MPWPKLVTRVPLASNFSTVATGCIWLVARSRQELAPHRSPTQIDRPSLSTSTALVDPQVRPAGSLAHPSTVWYGFGKIVGRRNSSSEQMDYCR